MIEKDTITHLAQVLSNIEGEMKQIEKQYKVTDTKLKALLVQLAGLYSWSKESPTPYGKIDLVMLQKQLQGAFDSLSSAESNVIKESLMRVGYESYARSTFILEKNAKVLTKNEPLSGRKLSKIVGNPLKGLTVFERAGANHSRLILDTKAVLIDGMTNGKEIGDIIGDLERKIQSGLNNTKRLLRTEAVRVWNQSALEAYQDSGIVEKVMFVAQLDDRTSTDCRHLDGKTFDLDEVWGKFAPPLHPNCRSVLVALLDDDSLHQLQNSSTGKGFQPLAFYRDWKTKRGFVM